MGRFPVRAAFLVAALGAALALVAAAAAAAANPTVRATLDGTCRAQNKLDANGVLLSFALICDARGACNCPAGTTLSYHAQSTSPGTGVSAREKGTITATGSGGSVTISLLGTRTSDGLSKGSWTLGKVSGFAGIHFRTSGRYTTAAKTLKQLVPATTTTVRISAAIDCWHCSRT